MDYEVIQINNDTWRIEEDGVRFFLLAGKERALLIDSGMTVHNAREIAESLTKLPLSLLNTHADIDHIGSNAQFETFYLHPAEEANYRRGGGTGTILPVREGDALDLGGRELPELTGKLRDGAERILAGEVVGRLAAFHGQKITAYDLGFATIQCDR